MYSVPLYRSVDEVLASVSEVYGVNSRIAAMSGIGEMYALVTWSCIASHVYNDHFASVGCMLQG